MKTRRPPSYVKCGQCGYTALKMMALHRHLIEHIGSVGYFYDIGQQVAFPKWKYDRPTVKLTVFTQTDEGMSTEEQNNSNSPEIKDEESKTDGGISIEEQNDTNPPEIKDEESTIVVKTELFEGAIDQQNDYQSSLPEVNPNIGLEFYEKNQAFNGTVDSVLSIADNEYFKQCHNLQSLKFNTNNMQIEKPKIPYEKRPRKKNKPKQLKIGQRKQTKKCTIEQSLANTQSQSAVNARSEDANTEEDKFPTESFRKTDMLSEADIIDRKTIPIDKLETVLDVEPSKICEVCGTIFTDKKLWASHRSNCRPKLHQCDICGKRFLLPARMRSHRIVHTDERSLFCDKCGKGFKTKQCLRIHQRRAHTEEKNYKCAQCGKSFTVNSQLIKHSRIHNNLLDYSCEFCGKKFSTSWNLKAHARQHTGTKPYPCSKCGESFAHNVSRKTHEAKCSIKPGGNDT